MLEIDIKIDIKEKVLFHFKIPKSDLNVNSFVNYCDKAGKTLSRKLFVNFMLKAQDLILMEYIGVRWGNPTGKITPWECPKCTARIGFKRRGNRNRTLKTSIGKVSFPLLQVTCSECGKTFSPFPTLLGFSARRQLTRELEQKLCGVVKNLSYGKTANMVNEIFGLNLSPHTVHKVVQKYGAKAKVIEDLSHISHLQSDSTKINASNSERGLDVHLALVIGPSEKRNGRKYRHKTFAIVQVSNSPTSVKKLLKKSQVDQITVDGKSGLEKFIEEKNIPTTVQRCLWHIPRTAAHMMYLDGLGIVNGRELSKPLKSILLNEQLSVNARLAMYDAFVEDCQKAALEKTVTFLENARSNLFTYKQFADQDVHGRTNSIIERQMREINRRMENGTRWSDTGAQNLLTLKLIHEMNPDSYANLWNLTKNKKFNFEVILC